jgi:hypothetical protein
MYPEIESKGKNLAEHPAPLLFKSLCPAPSASKQRDSGQWEATSCCFGFLSRAKKGKCIAGRQKYINCPGETRVPPNLWRFSTLANPTEYHFQNMFPVCLTMTFLISESRKYLDETITGLFARTIRHLRNSNVLRGYVSSLLSCGLRSSERERLVYLETGVYPRENF